MFTPTPQLKFHRIQWQSRTTESWSGNQTEDLDSHDSVYPARLHDGSPSLGLSGFLITSILAYLRLGGVFDHSLIHRHITSHLHSSSGEVCQVLSKGTLYLLWRDSDMTQISKEGLAIDSWITGYLSENRKEKNLWNLGRPHKLGNLGRLNLPFVSLKNLVFCRFESLSSHYLFDVRTHTHEVSIECIRLLFPDFHVRVGV